MSGPTQTPRGFAGGDPFTATPADPSPGLPAGGSDRKKGPMEFLNNGSQPAEPGVPTIVSSGGEKRGQHSRRSTQQPIGTVGKDTPVKASSFSTDVLGGHYLKVVIHASGGELERLLHDVFVGLGWRSQVLGSSAMPQTNSKHVAFMYCFDDLREAKEGIDDAVMVGTKVHTSFITQVAFATAIRSYGTAEFDTTYYDGQVVFVAQLTGDATAADEQKIAEEVKILTAEYGEISKMAEGQAVDGGYEYRVEYFKITEARKALESLTADKTVEKKGCTVFAKEIPDPQQTSPERRNVSFALTNTPHRIAADANGTIQSPTGRTAWRIDENGNEVVVTGSHQQPRSPAIALQQHTTPTLPLMVQQHTPAVQVPFHHINNTPMTRRPRERELQLIPSAGTTNKEPPVVIIERIRLGQDVRTTLMLRNIPNDMKTPELLNFLNATSRGRYDFVYLRFDFGKGTNIGYAFVNFEDPEDIAEFVEQREDAPWRPSQDLKTTRGVRCIGIAYATTQGVDCCIERFRNSSVMDEVAAFRPKLYYTTRTAETPDQIGKEKPFPPVNNEAKHQRSRDNAGMVGLYAPQPNGGRNGRGRAQRSQYDRGTQAQIQEEAYLNQMAPSPRRFVQPSFGGYPAPFFMPPQGFGGPAGYPNNGAFGVNGFPMQMQFDYNAAAFAQAFANAYNPGIIPMSHQLPYRQGSIGGDIPAGGAVQHSVSPGRANGYANGHNGNGAAYENGSPNGNGHYRY